jgi:outer membrane protein assembly factor BamE
MTSPVNSPINGSIKNNGVFKNFRPLVVLFALILTSCGSWLPDAHRIDITQGNTIKREALDKIHTGMKKSEITPILGSPLISDPFHAQRWDYIYRYIPGRGEPVQSRVTLFFESEVLVKIDDSEYREPEPEISEGAEPKPKVKVAD